MYQIKPSSTVCVAGVVALELEGDVDVHCSSQLQADIEALTQQEGLVLFLDLDRVRHLDSFSLGTFLALRQRLRRSGGSVCVQCNQPGLLRLFQITNLDKLFRFYESADDFIATLPLSSARQGTARRPPT